MKCLQTPIQVLDYLITTPKSNPSKYYKHIRKAVAFAFAFWELAMSTLLFQGGVILRIFVPDSGFGTCHVDHHGHFTLKQLRLSLVNETHTKPYTGPILYTVGHQYMSTHSPLRTTFNDIIQCPNRWK